MKTRHWLPMVAVLVVCAIASTRAGAAFGKGTWVTSDAYAAVVVLVGDKSSDTVKLAAQEFMDFWKKATGHGALMSKKPLKNSGVNVWIGKEGAPEELVSSANLAGLGPEGFCIRTAQPRKGRGPAHLLIAGEEDLGTLYGVYQFLEDYLDVHFLTPDLTYAPEQAPASLPEIELRFVPPFAWRQPSYARFAMQAVPEEPRKVFERRMRWSPAPVFGLTGSTIFLLLPPDKYFPEHPNFYSEIDGKRVAPIGVDLSDPHNIEQHPDLRSQLCFSNPKTAEALAEELVARMKAEPDKLIWSVSQMDWGEYCQCAECRAINGREGTPMGAWLTGVNYVADLIKPDFPKQRILTRAEGWSRKPPRTLRPRDNVIIELSAADCDAARPITDPKSAVNHAFAEDLAGWGNLTSNLYLRDYPSSNYFPQLPYPNFDTLSRNYPFYAEHHITGVEQSGGMQFADDFGALRCFLLSELLWRPETDIRPLIDAFAQAYYQEAAPFLAEYLVLLTRTVSEKDAVLRPFDKGAWIDADTVTRAEDIFQRAFAAAKSDPIRQKLEDAYSSVKYCGIVCAPKVDVADGKFTLTRPPCLSVEEYIARLTARGFNTFDPAQPVADYVMRRTGKAALPRQEESPIEKLENEGSLIWVLPAMKGSVVRWQDKRSGTELLRGFQRYGSAPGIWQDWTAADAPLADAYEVAERAAEHLVLRATCADGIIVERTLTLKPGTDAIEITLALTPPAGKSVSDAVKIHPEFFLQGAAGPEVYASKDQRWVRQNAGAEAQRTAAGASLPVQEYSGLSCFLPEKKLAIECVCDPAEAGGLRWFVDPSPDAQYCSLEVLTKGDPLNPGEKRTLHATYSISRARHE